MLAGRQEGTTQVVLVGFLVGYHHTVVGGNCSETFGF